MTETVLRCKGAYKISDLAWLLQGAKKQLQKTISSVFNVLTESKTGMS